MSDKQYSPYFYAAVVVLAVALIYLGNLLAVAPLEALGAAILGLGFLVVGLETLRSRFFDIGTDPGSLRSSSRFVFRGPGALPWGLLFATLGVGTMVIAGVVVFGLVEAAEQLVGRRPGIVIAPVGLIFLCSAAGWLWGEEQMNSSMLMVMVTLPQRLGALVTVLFSLAVLGVGLFELIAPAAFDQVVDMLRPPPAPRIPE